MSVSLNTISAFLDSTLDISRYRDSSVNGLQVEGLETVSKIAFAVDACMDSFRMARDAGAELLVVHHGLIWGGIKSVRGTMKKRLQFLLDNGISLYAAHIPLDAHATLGNNALLADMLALQDRKPFCEYHGKMISVAGKLPEATTAAELAEDIASKLNTTSRVEGNASRSVNSIGIVSGGGSFSLTEATDMGLDCLFTGEGNHASDLEAEDSGVPIIYAGHYQTETMGVKALMPVLAEQFGLEGVFVDTQE